jgi:hypothetical protein
VHKKTTRHHIFHILDDFKFLREGSVGVEPAGDFKYRNIPIHEQDLGNRFVEMTELPPGKSGMLEFELKDRDKSTPEIKLISIRLADSPIKGLPRLGSATEP